jgi:anaerobic ribonucleoside-triphosphate reductase
LKNAALADKRQANKDKDKAIAKSARLEGQIKELTAKISVQVRPELHAHMHTWPRRQFNINIHAYKYVLFIYDRMRRRTTRRMMSRRMHGTPPTLINMIFISWNS